MPSHDSSKRKHEKCSPSPPPSPSKRIKLEEPTSDPVEPAVESTPSQTIDALWSRLEHLQKTYNTRLARFIANTKQTRHSYVQKKRRAKEVYWSNIYDALDDYGNTDDGKRDPDLQALVADMHAKLQAVDKLVKEKRELALKTEVCPKSESNSIGKVKGLECDDEVGEKGRDINRWAVVKYHRRRKEKSIVAESIRDLAIIKSGTLQARREELYKAFEEKLKRAGTEFQANLEYLELDLLHSTIKMCEEQVELYQEMDTARLPDVVLYEADISEARSKCRRMDDHRRSVQDP
jgi:hypothetical protein